MNPKFPDELYDEFELLLFEFDEFDEFDEFEVFDELEDIPLDEELPLSLVAFFRIVCCYIICRITEHILYHRSDFVHIRYPNVAVR